MAITNITESSTFRAWYLVTNEIIDNLNANVVINGGTVLGQYKIGYDANTANTWLDVANSLYVDSSALQLKSNVTFGANVVANSSVRVFSIAANTFVVAPISGTRFDTSTLANANLSVNATLGITATGNLAVSSPATFTNDVTISGNVAANGIFSTRQLIYATGGAIAANTIAGGQYDNWTPAGIANCSVLNITPSANAVITGIAAPTNLGASGARILYIQNLSTAYYINLHSANASSDASNRFMTPGNSNVVIMPGSALPLIYVAGVNQWRLLAAPSTSSGDADLTVTGNLSVQGSITGNTNTAFGATLYVDKVNARVGIGKNNPGYQLETTANAFIGNQLIAPTVNATTIVYSPAGNFGSGVSIANASGLITTGYISANSGTSYVRTFTGNTISVANSVGTANLTVSAHTALATVYGTGNTTLLDGAFVANSSGNTVTISNTITVNGATNSYINVLKVTSFVSTSTVNSVSLGVSGNAAFANVTVSANISMANASVSSNISLANATFTAVVKASGSSARLVIPVGTNYYAT